MSSILSNLIGLKEVYGAVVFDESGTCLENQLKAPYEPEMILRVMRQIQEDLEPLRYVVNQDLELFMAKAAGGYMIIARFDRFRLFALAGKDLNPALFNVALSVVPLKIEGYLKASEPGSPRQMKPPRRSPMSGNMVDEAKLRAIVKALIIQVGPIAKVFLKQELEKIGASEQSLDRALVPALVNALGDRIKDREKRKGFLIQARKI